MIKKSFFIGVFIFSFIQLAQAASVTIEPHSPDSWAYHFGVVNLNGKQFGIGPGVTFNATSQDKVSIIQVYAMNFSPRIANECFNLKIDDDKANHFYFTLAPESIVRCWKA